MTHFRRRRRTLALTVLAALAVAGCSTTVVGQAVRATTVQPVPTVPTVSTVSPTATPSPARPSVTTPTTRPLGPSSGTSGPSVTPSSSPGTTPATASTSAGTTDGAAGAGDPYYPLSGNGGYQVDKYAVTITYDPRTNRLDGSADISATVTARSPLARFNLDLQPQMVVTGVRVNGAAATYRQQQAELVIAPAAPAAPDATLSVEVEYGGQPGEIRGGAANLGDGGWYRTPDGGAVAVGEPYSASAWYPVNEHPSDTAMFSVTVTVPDGWDVIANGTTFDGALPKAPAGSHTVGYVLDKPVASYLTTVLIDKLTFTTDSYDGIPIVNAFTAAGADAKELAGQTSQILKVLSAHFGPFPFDSYGGIYTGQNLSFALETATRPVYASWVDLDTVVHETAHQWYGDDVTIAQWRDICLNECFASYAPWLYHQDVDGADLDAHWKSEMAAVAGDPSFWSSPLVDMGAGNEFTAVYDRGPLAVHALRHKMGEEAFASLLTGWVATYGGKNASFGDFETYASTIAGTDLTAFINAWFRGAVVPPEPFRTPPGLG